MSTATKQTRENRTITVDFRDDATYVQLLGDGKAFVEFVCAFLLSLGFQLAHKATCRGGGCLTRHSHYARVRLGGLTIWRVQCTTCRAVFTVLPHFVLRYRQMRPDIARDVLLATHGGLSLELCAVIHHISPMALYRLVCALGGCPRINIHPSVGVGLSAWMSSLALFCRLGYHLNTARGDVPDAVPTTKGLLERHVGGSDRLKPSSRDFYSATA